MLTDLLAYRLFRDSYGSLRAPGEVFFLFASFLFGHRRACGTGPGPGPVLLELPKGGGFFCLLLYFVFFDTCPQAQALTDLLAYRLFRDSSWSSGKGVPLGPVGC